MRKAARHLDGVDSSNPRRWRGKRLHHHGGGVCWLFVLLWMDSWRHELIVCKKWYKNNLKMKLKALHFDPRRRAPHQEIKTPHGKKLKVLPIGVGLLHDHHPMWCQSSIVPMSQRCHLCNCQAMLCLALPRGSLLRESTKCNALLTPIQWKIQKPSWALQVQRQKAPSSSHQQNQGKIKLLQKLSCKRNRRKPKGALQLSQQ